MPNSKTRISRIAVAVALIILGIGFGYFVLRPTLQVRTALRLVAAVEVGHTTKDQFRRMAITSGVHLDEGPSGFSLERRNRVLEYLHLAPQTVVRIDVRLADDLVNGISVRAWIGEWGHIANIDIREFDSHNTACGDVPVCVKPTSSTMLTTAFVIPSTPTGEREHLMSLDSWCLAKLGGCKNSREFFPAAWEHEHP